MGGGVQGGGGQGRCERRSEVFVKIKKKNWEVGRGRVGGVESGEGGGRVLLPVGEQNKTSCPSRYPFTTASWFGRIEQ